VAERGEAEMKKTAINGYNQGECNIQKKGFLLTGNIQKLLQFQGEKEKR